MEKLLKICKGFGISIVLFVVLNIITAILMRYTNLSENQSIIYIVITMTICSMIFCLFVGNTFMKRGLLLGIVFSSAYILLLIYLLLLAFQENFRLEILKTIYIIPVVGGTIASIIGTNLKK